MSSFRIKGGQKLKGEITPQGAKNEALQVICAPLLTGEPVTIHNVPDILDVNKLIELVGDLGCTVEKLQKGSYKFTAANVNIEFLKTSEYRKKAAALRGSVMLLGPILARFGKANIPKPGGDKIGRRRLDTHFIGFRNLGAKFNFDANENLYNIDASHLKGCYMLLDEASVTGTANIVMAAVLAKGTTTIYNAACEPYLQQLCDMLNRMGAKISGIGSNLLT
ncbi:MAG: UDP-N-acetylglucosamine 1-carboxyvinyltransferase, partial [Bacteroidia bacterium]|nr:UDP-N-acetylglucosamine 1-carboxyvinyltransferase [Bacteroidia bacterium]